MHALAQKKSMTAHMTDPVVCSSSYHMVTAHHSGVMDADRDAVKVQLTHRQYPTYHDA